jgi:hypothetical protein
MAWHGIRDTVIQRRRKKQTRDNVARVMLKRQMFGKRCLAKLESIIGIRNQSSRQQLCLRKERTNSNGIRGLSRR